MSIDEDEDVIHTAWVQARLRMEQQLDLPLRGHLELCIEFPVGFRVWRLVGRWVENRAWQQVKQLQEPGDG